MELSSGHAAASDVLRPEVQGRRGVVDQDRRLRAAGEIGLNVLGHVLPDGVEGVGQGDLAAGAQSLHEEEGHRAIVFFFPLEGDLVGLRGGDVPRLHAR